MVFADQLEQSHLAAVLEDRHVYFGEIHIDLLPAQFLHQLLRISVLVRSS